MLEKCQLDPINLSDATKIDSLVEHRRVFNLNRCELSIFETFHKCSDVILSYDGLVISSMMRGRKLMSVADEKQFDFLPGESVILPEWVKMKVDFPDADLHTPVQCATLAMDWDMVDKNLAFLNEYYPNTEGGKEWKLEFDRYHFANNKELAASINRLISISMEDSLEKDALADLSLKFLLMRIIQTQNLAIAQEKILHSNHHLVGVIHFIQNNLTDVISIDNLAKEAGMSKSVFFTKFKKHFGLTPVEYILKERINHAKSLLQDTSLNITDICYQSGFNNMNYFIKQFKKLEGMTPKQYRT